MTDLSGSTFQRTLLTPLGNPHSPDRAVRSMFAAVAPRYDFLNHLLSLWLDIAWRKATAKVLREILARPGSLTLDLCCGTGDLTLALGRFSAGKVIGADFCHPMVQRALAKRGDLSRTIFFLEADALALPFSDGTADLVAVAFGFRNLADYARGLAEMTRVLKPNGVVAILEFSKMRWPVLGWLFRLYFHQVLPRLGTWISGIRGPYQYLPDSVSRFPDQESLAAALRRAGFVNVRYRNFSGGIAALHMAQKS